MSLGIKRALMVALVYTGSMAGCALAIVVCADRAAREAAPVIVPMLMPPAAGDVQRQHATVTKLIRAASNAAIIASVEARQASRKEAAKAARTQIEMQATAARAPQNL